MTKRGENRFAFNEAETTLSVFMESYNKSAPGSFPRASVKSLKQFQETYPTLFKNDEWSIDKHRKRFMDWLSSHQDEV